MTLKRNTAISIFFSLILILCIGQSTYAAENQEIKISAQKTLENFSQLIDANRSHLNISKSENISDMHLGNGYKCLNINMNSIKNIKNSNVECKLNSIVSTNSNTYLFPVILNNRQVATAYVDYYKNKWQIVRVSSNNSLEENIQEAKVKYSLNDSDINLINDESIGVLAIANQINFTKDIIPLEDNSILGLKKYVKMNTVSLANNINKKILSNNNITTNVKTRGAATSSKITNNNTNTNIYILVAVVGAVAVMAILLYKIRINKKAN